jgi:opacity protein-like surface antigen
MKRVFAASTIVLVMAATVQAQDLTGKWEETSSSGLQIALDLTATKTTVNGTFTVKGRPLPITEGIVSGNKFTFKAKLADQPEGFTGELVGDEITLMRDRNKGADSVSLKRAPVALTGTWKGRTTNGFEVMLDLVAADGALTGTLTREGVVTKITDGKVSGNAFTFKATLGEQIEGFTGTIGADSITVRLDRQGPEKAVVFKRVTK